MFRLKANPSKRGVAAVIAVGPISPTMDDAPALADDGSDDDDDGGLGRVLNEIAAHSVS